MLTLTDVIVCWHWLHVLTLTDVTVCWHRLHVLTFTDGAPVLMLNNVTPCVDCERRLPVLTLADVILSTGVDWRDSLYSLYWSDSSTDVIPFTDVTPSIDVNKTPCVGAEWMYSLCRGWLTWFSVLTWNDVIPVCWRWATWLCWRGMTLLLCADVGRRDSLCWLWDLTPSLDFE